MPTNSEKKEQDIAASDISTKPNPERGLKILRLISRKKYRVSDDPNAWVKRGCYYTGSEEKSR